MEVHRLEVLTGSAPGGLTLASMPLRKVVVQPDIPIGLPAQLLERRPDILQAEATLIAANAHRPGTGLFLSHLSITGQGGLQSAEFANWFTGNSANFSIGPPSPCPFSRGPMSHGWMRRNPLSTNVEGYQQTILLAFEKSPISSCRSKPAPSN